jgi:hypothetical protein
VYLVKRAPMVKRVASVPVIDHLLIRSDPISQTRSMPSVGLPELM